MRLKLALWRFCCQVLHNSESEFCSLINSLKVRHQRYQAILAPLRQCRIPLGLLTHQGTIRGMMMVRYFQVRLAEAIGHCNELHLSLYNHLISTHEFNLSTNLEKPPGFSKKFKFATLWETSKVCETFHKVTEHLFPEHLFPKRMFVLSQPNIEC